MKLILKHARHRSDPDVVRFELRSGTLRTGLSRIQGMIVLALLGSSYMDRVELSEVVWPDPDVMPDYWCNTLHTHVCYLNRKLIQHGQRVVSRNTIWRLEKTVVLERMVA